MSFFPYFLVVSVVVPWSVGVLYIGILARQFYLLRYWSASLYIYIYIWIVARHFIYILYGDTGPGHQFYLLNYWRASLQIEILARQFIYIGILRTRFSRRGIWRSKKNLRVRVEDRGRWDTLCAPKVQLGEYLSTKKKLCSVKRIYFSLLESSKPTIYYYWDPIYLVLLVCNVNMENQVTPCKISKKKGIKAAKKVLVKRYTVFFFWLKYIKQQVFVLRI